MSWLDRLKGKSGEDSAPDTAQQAETEEGRPILAPRERASAPAPSPEDITLELEEELERALEIDLGNVIPLAEARQEAPIENPDLPEQTEEDDSDPTEALMQEALTAVQAKDYETALSIWEPLARAGNSRAQNNIGACFIDGLGVEQDYELARQWLELAAEDGDPVGRRNLANLCLKGQGGPQDAARALELYRQAATDGDSLSQDMLSWLLLNGENGVPANMVEARRWALAAAEQGVASAMTRLGMIAYKGIPTARLAANPTEAVQWWTKAAKAGDVDGQAMLGAAHHSGVGLPRDRVASYAWLLRAKAGKSPLADEFMAMVEPTLSPEERAAAKRRASMPLDEAEA
ncbi:tetratricopeptide repeat protein [Xanthobacter sp. TB0136]|uniref:tetratricopeptide repeat protein n=1 Tax=Xanthobacter sp. TB0136 TaxID=3459177 RepID=UPI00403A09F8